MGELLGVRGEEGDLQLDVSELCIKRPRTVFEALGKEALASPATAGTHTLIPDGYTVTGTAENIDSDYAYLQDDD